MARYKVLKDMRNARTGFSARKGTVIQGREVTKKGRAGVVLMRPRMRYTYQFIPNEMIGTVIELIPGDLGIGSPKGFKNPPLSINTGTPTRAQGTPLTPVGPPSPKPTTPVAIPAPSNFDGNRMFFDNDSMSYFDDEEDNFDGNRMFFDNDSMSF